MAKQITKWADHDGKLWDTLEEAEASERNHALMLQFMAETEALEQELAENIGRPYALISVARYILRNFTLTRKEKQCNTLISA